MDMYDVQDGITGLFKRVAGTICYTATGAVVAGAGAVLAAAGIGGPVMAAAVLFGIAGAAVCGVGRIFGIEPGRLARGMVIGATVGGMVASPLLSPFIIGAGIICGAALGFKEVAKNIVREDKETTQRFERDSRNGIYGLKTQLDQFDTDYAKRMRKYGMSSNDTTDDLIRSMRRDQIAFERRMKLGL